MSSSPVPTILPIPEIVKLQAITKAGNYAQWIACAVFIIGAVVLSIPSVAVHRKASTFHLVTAVLCAITALSYYAMATGSGTTFATVGIEHYRNVGGGGYDVIISRQIFYVRFIEWFLTTPLILLNLALLAGLSWADVFSMIIADEMMIVSGFMAGVTSKSRAMYGWYGFMLLFLVYIVYIFAVRARRASAKQPNHITSLYDLVFVLTFVFIFPYVVIFILGDGTGHLSVDVEVIVFVALDFAIRLIIPAILILAYEAKLHESGCGPNAIPDHIFEPRAHGWTGAVQLPSDE